MCFAVYQVPTVFISSDTSYHALSAQSFKGGREHICFKFFSEYKIKQSLTWRVLFAIQFVIFKPLSYCFEETIGFDVKTSFASRPKSRLIRWYNKAGDMTKEFWEKAIKFHETFYGLKITNCIQFALQSFAPNISNKSAYWETDNYAASLIVTSEINKGHL